MTVRGRVKYAEEITPHAANELDNITTLASLNDIYLSFSSEKNPNGYRCLHRFVKSRQAIFERMSRKRWGTFRPSRISNMNKFLLKWPTKPFSSGVEN